MMLLDTCALLWLAHDQSKISAETLAKIETAAAVYIGSITGLLIVFVLLGGKEIT